MNAYRRRASIALAVFASLSASSIASAGTTPGAVTISLSGSTAMRAFTTNANITALQPGTSITLNTGIGGAPQTYTAAPVDAGGGIFPSVQLASSSASTFDPYSAISQTNANFLAIRLEWHEQGSVEGIIELVNDEVAPISVGLPARNPSVGNPTWVNRASLTAAGVNAGGFIVSTDPTNYNPYTSFNAAGTNLAGGQNRVQMAISDVNATQGFSRTGSSAAIRTAPGGSGYGKGNPALGPASANATGTGVTGGRQQLFDQSVLNMSTDRIDPQTGANYTTGAWNNAGTDNLNSIAVAATATTFAANPGTGLTRVNRTDAQFLQATGRLGNGADFNVVTRDVGSGTRNVASMNVGLDPSFTVGENDGGDTGAVVGATDAQQVIGAGIKFSGKTAGGAGLRPTVQNSRMAIGHLSLSDVRGGNTNNVTNAGSRPLRALAYRDDADDTADASNAALIEGFTDPTSGTFVLPSFDTITDGSYAVMQNEQYVTVKTPDANYAAGKIKGDNTGDDVKDFRDNILGSAAAFPLGSSFLNPANGMLANSFVPEKFMMNNKATDGLHQLTANPSFDAANYNAVKSFYAANFSVGDPSTITAGASSRYGDVTPAGTGAIAITADNYLFGDFNQDGQRDYGDIAASATALAALKTSGHGTSMFTGDANTSSVTVASLAGINGGTGAKKGDLIVKGDFNSDGVFDGRDLYLLARGSALADSNTAGGLTEASGVDFGDRVRNGVLRKNAALDWLKANVTDPTTVAEASSDGGKGFDKFDVNRDGVVNRKDAQIVDYFVGKDYRKLQDQLNAVVKADKTAFVDASGAPLDPTNPANDAIVRKSISLVDVELTDDGVINAIGAASDFASIRTALGSAVLLTGDTNFDGNVNFDDLLKLAQNYGNNVDRWSLGDVVNADGVVNFDDLLGLSQNYGGTVTGTFAGDWALAQSEAPEPATIAMVVGVAPLVLRRRRAAR